LRSFLSYGAPVESNFLCPVCRSKPPHRLAAIYFDTHHEILLRGGTFLHVAPEAGLGIKLTLLARDAGMTYRAGGITGEGDRYIDLLSLPFADSSVVLIYCCHVLNCLQDDRAAMREVYRVLHPDGLAILQVPAFHAGDTTLETNSLEERIAEFSDDGIYRCYTNEDYEGRLRSVGFEVRAFRAGEVAAGPVERYQLKREVMHLCRRSKGVKS